MKDSFVLDRSLKMHFSSERDIASQSQEVIWRGQDDMYMLGNKACISDVDLVEMSREEIVAKFDTFIEECRASFIDEFINIYFGGENSMVFKDE